MTSQGEVTSMSTDQFGCVAVIPARGGSKGIPRKNLARVGGVSLVGRAVAAALSARGVDRVVVSTDDDEIADDARAHGAEVIERPADLASDVASSEAALLHVLETLRGAGVDVDIVAFLQATSPFIDVAALDRAIERVAKGDCDVVFSAKETHAFLWELSDGRAVGVNHDDGVRPRRQDLSPQFQETGGFYVMRARGLEEAGFRFFGRVGIEEVPATTAFEIDVPEDLRIAAALLPLVDDPGLEVDVDGLVMDFDGVHTDDLVAVAEDGRESVAVSRSDGMGIALLARSGVKMLILSSETNPVVAARAAKLRVEVVQASKDKVADLTAWCDREGLDLRRVAYVGNDVNDLGCLEIVGWPVAVRDARPQVTEAARLVLAKPGGRGAVRELADIIVATREHRKP